MPDPARTSADQPRPRAAIAWTREGWTSERPRDDRDWLEIWCHTDRFSYFPGDRVDIHLHTTARQYSIRVFRDGASPRTVFAREGLAGAAHDTPEDS